MRYRYTALIAAVAVLIATPAMAREKLDEPRTWRIEMANDTTFGSDNQFTNGFNVSVHSPTFTTLDDVRGTAAFGKRIARGLLPKREDMNYREAFVIGQNMQTPEDIEDPGIILDDAAYMGMLGVASSWVAFNDQRFSGYQMLFGLVGPEAFAEDTQSAVHSLIGSDDPEGWDNQLDNEPIVNFYYSKKRKWWRNKSFDGAGSFEGMVGNFATAGFVSLETRFGRLPDGFTYVPTPLGAGMTYDATIPPTTKRRAIYGSVVLRLAGFVDRIWLDGNHFTDTNEWTENNTLEGEDAVGHVIVGFHVDRQRFGFHMNWWFSSDSIDEDTLNPINEDPSNDFGTFMFEWRSKAK